MADFEVDRTSPAYRLGVAEYERDKYKSELANQREKSARLIEEMIDQRIGKKRPDVRMALAIAASAVRRGRHLTEGEQLENLAKGFEETDPEWANEFRRKAGISRPVERASEPGR